MLPSGTACDAVGWLLAAQQHHAATSLGSVYRFLREMEQRGFVEVEAKPHSRCRWRLKDLMPTLPSGELQAMLEPLQAFLRDMEALGLAEALGDEPEKEIIPHDIGRFESKTVTPLWRLLQRVAGSLGYRLVPRHSNLAY